MKNLIPLIVAVLLYAKPGYAQNDAEAKRILDNFSSKALSSPSVSMNFEMITSDLTENRSDTLTGSLIISKNKYRLSLPDNTVWFNGEESWSYLPAEQEVTITKPDKKDKSFQNRPAEIFTMYKSGFKCRLVDEKSGMYIIDLYPEDIKSDLIRVRIYIGIDKLDLRGFEYKRRDGIIATLNVSEYNLKIKPGPETFRFDTEKYKGADLIDMR